MRFLLHRQVPGVANPKPIAERMGAEDLGFPFALAYTETSMRRLASIFAIFILLLTAAPLLACMTESVMSQEESACCRAMHGKCDGMEKMGCCRTEVRTDEHPQTAASAPTIDLHLAVVDWLDPSVSEVRNAPPSVLGIPDAHSPPGLVIARITVLRI
jgi:hypothetical protein